jgi:hypothetical protein
LDYGKVMIVDLLVIMTQWILDRKWGFNRSQSQMTVVYEKIELIKKKRGGKR